MDWRVFGAVDPRRHSSYHAKGSLYTNHHRHGPFFIICQLMRRRGRRRYRSDKRMQSKRGNYTLLLFSVHHSPFTIHYSPFTIHHSLFTTHRSLLTIHCSPFTIHHSPLTINYSLFTAFLTVHCLCCKVATNQQQMRYIPVKTLPSGREERAGRLSTGPHYKAAILPLGP